MKKQVIKINENQLKYIVAEATKRILKEGESGGWVVDSSEAQEAYQYFCQELGEERANEAIIRALGSSALSDVLAFLFRMYNLRGWESFKENGYTLDDDYYDENEDTLNEDYEDTTKTVRLGFDGPIYGCTLEGEWFAYDPSKMNSIPCQSEEEARMKAEEMKKRMDAEEFKSRKDFNLMNSMD